MRAALLGLALLVQLQTNSCVAAQNNCPPPSAAWMAYDQDNMPEHRVIMTAMLEADGTIRWHGAAISEARLITYLSRARNIDPSPYFVLRYQHGVSCETLQHLFRIFEDHVGCGITGVCSVAQAT
jgi:hypothetical protein